MKTFIRKTTHTKTQSLVCDSTQFPHVHWKGGHWLNGAPGVTRANPETASEINCGTNCSCRALFSAIFFPICGTRCISPSPVQRRDVASSAVLGPWFLPAAVCLYSVDWNKINLINLFWPTVKLICYSWARDSCPLLPGAPVGNLNDFWS